MIYSEAERREQIARMRDVTATFYYAATHTGVHAFVEFCGLMQKYVDVCERTSKGGRDFNEANTHGPSESLEVEAHDVIYLAEKFDCIFGPTLSDPKRRQLFIACMGWP